MYFKVIIKNKYLDTIKDHNQHKMELNRQSSHLKKDD